MKYNTKFFFCIFAYIFFFLISCNRENKTAEEIPSDPGIATDSIKDVITDSLNQPDSMFAISEEFCVDYAGTETFLPANESFVEFTKRSKNYFKGKQHVSGIFVKENFLMDQDSFVIKNIWTEESTGEKISTENYIKNTDFYLADTIIRTDLFTGLVYEAIDAEGSSKFLCTLDSSGKLISTINIAFFLHSGSSTADDGSKIPWYANKKGCIQRDLRIYFVSDISIKKLFQILDNGKIIELKG